LIRYIVISPTHKRAEGPAPVGGYKLTSKAAALQGGSSRNRCYAERKVVGSGGGDLRGPAFLEQPSPRKFGISLKGSFGISLIGLRISCWFLRALPPACPARVAHCPRPQHDPPCLIFSGLVFLKNMHDGFSTNRHKRSCVHATESWAPSKGHVTKKRAPRAYHGQRGGTSAICGGWTAPA
jgi:hypothetical protein